MQLYSTLVEEEGDEMGAGLGKEVIEMGDEQAY